MVKIEKGQIEFTSRDKKNFRKIERKGQSFYVLESGDSKKTVRATKYEVKQLISEGTKFKNLIELLDTTPYHLKQFFKKEFKNDKFSYLQKKYM